ncbi:MAG: hypothetical protein ACUVWZ_03990 [Anaerolineae bacterium]
MSTALRKVAKTCGVGPVWVWWVSHHWDALDWLFYILTPVERDCSPLASGVMDGDYGWMVCPEYVNPDGSCGFFNVNNVFLLSHIRQMSQPGSIAMRQS